MRSTALMILMVPLLACSSSDGGTDPPDVQTGTVAGQVTDGAGVTGVAVSASRAGMATRVATTGADGRFSLANLATGTWQVGLTIPATHEADPGQVLPASAAVVANQTVGVTLLLRRRLAAGTIGGSVRDGTDGVAGAGLQLTGPGVSRQATTGGSGTYAFDNVAAGAYTVAVTVPAGFTLAAGDQATKPVTLAAGQSAFVNFSVTQPDNGQVREITLANFSFTPQNATITAGTRVRWNNPTSMIHTITPNGNAEWTDTEIYDGATFEHVFNTPGVYNYRCTLHLAQGMTGVITVQ